MRMPAPIPERSSQMYSRKVMKSALETMMFMWGEPLEVRDAAEVLEAEKSEVR